MKKKDLTNVTIVIIGVSKILTWNLISMTIIKKRKVKNVKCVENPLLKVDPWKNITCWYIPKYLDIIPTFE